MGKRKQGRRRVRKPVREVHLRFSHARDIDDTDDTERTQRAGQSGHSGRGERAERQSPPLREQLNALLGAVLEASEAALTDVVDGSASVLAASAEQWPEAGRVLLLLTDQLLAKLWSNGWQPADVVRMARRELTPRHVRLAADLIAAEARRYPGAALPPRWAAQLAELDAERVHWGADDAAFLPAVAAREKADRFSTASAVFELLRLLCWLPPIKPVGPPPGRSAAGSAAQRPGGPRRGATPAADRMLDRIRALLAKAESTEFAEEAEALTGKAQQLMAQHSIDAALLSVEGGGRDEPEAIRIGVDAPYEPAKTALLNAVADANRCRAVWSQELGFCTVLGFAVDLEAVELLYTSLLVQATTAMNQASGRSRSFRQSFLVAYAHRIAQRLSEATEAAAREAVAATAGEQLLPVLAARDESVRESTRRMFPELTSTRMPAARDYEGWVAGVAAADRARLRGEAAING